MKDKDVYLGLELFFTFFLLALVIFLSGGLFSFRLRQYLIIGLILGFSFSWFTRQKANHLIKLFITIGAVGILVWIIYSILNSSFYYKEIILICLKAAFILEFVLSFNANPHSFLAYIQALSVPLFMSHPIFLKDYSPLSFVLTLGYVICWLAILKVKFYGFINPFRDKKFRISNTLYLPVILFFTSIFISWVFFTHSPLGNIEKGGFFPEGGSSLETGLDDLETEYYDLQDNVQKKVTRLIPEFRSSEDRYAVLKLLDKFIKDSRYTIELEKAELGLESRLKTPGPGLEKGDTQELTYAMDKYLDKKTALNLKKIKAKIRESLTDNRFKIKNMISVLLRVGKILYNNSYRQVSAYENEIKRIIDTSYVDTKVKKELKELTDQLKEWKAFDIYRQKSVFLDKKIASLDGGLKNELTALLAQIRKIETISDVKETENKIKTLEEGNRQLPADIINDMKEILDLKSQILILEESGSLKEKLEQSGLSEYEVRELKEKVDTIKDAENKQQLSEDLSKFQERTEKTQVDISRQTEELADLKAHILAKEKKEEELARELEKVKLDKEKEARREIESLLRGIFIIGGSFSIAGIIIAVGALYFLTEKKKNKFKFSLNENPREFILNLYENAKKILDIFNLNYKDILPPLLFAELVQKRYSIEDDVFLRFTARFEEAKYSQHTLQSEVAVLVLNDYNNFLKILFSRFNNLLLFFKYCQALFKRTPLFISKR